MTATKLLIDSHVLVWLLYEPERFDRRVLDALQAAEAVYISMVSLWELAIKHANGQLRYKPADLAKGIESLGVALMPLKPTHSVMLEQIVTAHKDPFDRMLLAQALAEGCVFVTADNTVLEMKYKTLAV